MPSQIHLWSFRVLSHEGTLFHHLQSAWAWTLQGPLFQVSLSAANSKVLSVDGRDTMMGTQQAWPLCLHLLGRLFSTVCVRLETASAAESGASKLLQEGASGQSSGKDSSNCFLCKSLPPNGDVITFSLGYCCNYRQQRKGLCLAPAIEDCF